jgi:hypothetical protein
MGPGDGAARSKVARKVDRRIYLYLRFPDFLPLTESKKKKFLTIRPCSAGFWESLKSGVVLCKAVNCIRPNMIEKINLKPIALMERVCGSYSLYADIIRNLR